MAGGTSQKNQHDTDTPRDAGFWVLRDDRPMLGSDERLRGGHLGKDRLSGTDGRLQISVAVLDRHKACFVG